MSEKLKLKYRKLCQNIDFFYETIDEFNSLMLTNSTISKETKLRIIIKIKEKEPLLYQAMLEDINASNL